MTFEDINCVPWFFCILQLVLANNKKHEIYSSSYVKD